MSQGLKGLAGVVSAEVSYDERLAVVEYRPELVSPAQLVEAVKSFGFGARIAEGVENGATGS